MTVVTYLLLTDSKTDEDKHQALVWLNENYGYRAKYAVEYMTSKADNAVRGGLDVIMAPSDLAVTVAEMTKYLDEGAALLAYLKTLPEDEAASFTVARVYLEREAEELHRGILTCQDIENQYRCGGEDLETRTVRYAASDTLGEIDYAAARDLILEVLDEAIAAGRYDDHIRRIVCEGLADGGPDGPLEARSL